MRCGVGRSFFSGMDCNWDLLPSPSEQKEFLTHYLRSSSAGSATSADVEDLLSEVEPFFPVSHLFWGLLQNAFSLFFSSLSALL